MNNIRIKNGIIYLLQVPYIVAYLLVILGIKKSYLIENILLSVPSIILIFLIFKRVNNARMSIVLTVINYLYVIFSIVFIIFRSAAGIGDGIGN